MATEQQLRDYLKRATIELNETRTKLTQLHNQQTEPIAIIGMGCRYPGGANTPEQFWKLLSEGRDGVVEVPADRWNIDEYYDADRPSQGGMYTRHGAFLSDITGWDAEFFGMSPQEALRMDPQQRLLMELVWEALEDAGTPPPMIAGSDTGVLLGYMDSMQYGRLQVERQGEGVIADPYFGQGSSASVVAGRIAYHYNLRGPAVTMDTACSSSLTAVHLAVNALRNGECELAVAGGASAIVQADTFMMACATSMLSADGACKTFDASADGYVMGEGGGILVLERLSSALASGRRIRAVIRGSAVNQDGASNGMAAPNRRAQVEVMRRAMSAAGVTPDEVDYVEAHGTGTKLGDAIELSALQDVYAGRPAERPVIVGAVKTAIGHTQAAAGVAGLIKTTLLLENGKVPQNLNLTAKSDALSDGSVVQPPTEMLTLPAEREKWVAGVSSFGWSGTNAHVIMESAPTSGATTAQHGPQVLPVSAASPSALTERMRGLADWLDGRGEGDLADAAFTLQTGRAEHRFRQAVACTDVADAVARLRAAADAASPTTVDDRPRVAFLLPGVGDHHRGIGQDLYRAEPVFAAAVDDCLNVLSERCAVDLRPVLFTEDAAAADGDLARSLGRTESGVNGSDPLAHAEVAHPLMFTIEYATARLLDHWGVRPDVLVGYSIGEYVGACLAGVLSLADALQVVVERARLIATVANGEMLAVAAAAEQTQALLADGPADVAIAAINGPTMTVLSGSPEGIADVAKRLTEAGIAHQPLRTTHAFHSPLLAPVQEKMADLLASVPRSTPATTVMSNVTGEPLTAEQATSPAYWGEHLVMPVRFADSVRRCIADGVTVFVELGAGQTLGGMLRQCAEGADDLTVLGTLPARLSRSRHAYLEMLDTRGKLWERGVAFAEPMPDGRIVSLPPYPFQRAAFWPSVATRGERTRPAAATTGPADLAYVPSWERDNVRQPVDDRLPGTLVILTDERGVGTELARSAAAAGTTVIEVATGQDLRHAGSRTVIDPGELEHYREALRPAEKDGGEVHVVHLWGLDDSASTGELAGDEQLEATVSLGYGSLMLTLQACGELLDDRPVRLVTVSRGAVEVLGADATAPHQAITHGLARVAEREYPDLTWRGVDLDPESDDAEQAARQLERELRTALPEESVQHDDLVAWRRDRRWQRSWAPLHDESPSAAPWRDDGAYLITGGTRGLGMALAKHLVRQGVRKLALLGRTSPAHGSTPADDRQAQTMRDVAELEAAGADVLLIRADCGVPQELRAAFTRCRDHFGALHGVIHTAGVPSGGMIQRRAVADSAYVIAPKVLAMGPLAELVTSDDPPELLVLYSSAITAFGGIGEGEYCAANAVLDAYGDALTAMAPRTRVLTVAWGPWLHDDWQAHGAGVLGERVRAYRERYGFSAEAGCAFLDELVASGMGSVLAVRQTLQEARGEWSAMLDIADLTDAVSPAAAGERFPRPNLRSEYAAPRTDRERTLAEIWGAYLGIDKVGVHDPFFDLGGNSLVALAMVRVVERELDIAIAPAVLFEHPTIAEFAAAVDRTGAADPAAELAAVTARGQRRRRAQSGARR